MLRTSPSENFFGQSAEHILCNKEHYVCTTETESYRYLYWGKPQSHLWESTVYRFLNSDFLLPFKIATVQASLVLLE